MKAEMWENRKGAIEEANLGPIGIQGWDSDGVIRPEDDYWTGQAAL